MSKKIFFLAFFVYLFWSIGWAKNAQKGPSREVYPASLLLLDDYFSHHIIVAEKSTHRLYLYRNNKGRPILLKSYKMTTGKKPGDKIFRGDYRTPEGVYFFTDFLTRKQLLKDYGKEGEIYGVGAFVMDYPNPVDILNKKTGHSIWLHSTNDESRIEKGLDSRGCVVTSNKDLIEIASYIELQRTSIIVVQDLVYLSAKVWEQKRRELKKTFTTWLDAWREEDLKKYFSGYHQKFRHPQKGSFQRFKKYKKYIFSLPGKPKIEASHLDITQTKEYAVITFLQHYKSNTIDDIGRKTLYLKQDDYYRWKIISESWTKKGISPSSKQITFQPRMHFFKTRDPAQILNLNNTSYSQKSTVRKED